MPTRRSSRPRRDTRSPGARRSPASRNTLPATRGASRAARPRRGTRPARLGPRPTPDQFAAAWASCFEQVVSAAAGEDGLLTTAEASEIASRHDALRLWGDNAEHLLASMEGMSQPSLAALTAPTTAAPATAASTTPVYPVPTLVARGYAYALRCARAVAGPDGRVSPAGGHLLASDLSADFFFLTGRHAPRADRQTLAAAAHEVRAAIEPGGGLCSCRLVELTARQRLPARLRAALAGARQALGPAWYGSYVVFAWDIGLPWNVLANPPPAAYMVISQLGLQAGEPGARRTVLGFAPDGTQVLSERL